MSVIYILIVLSVVLAGAFLISFRYAIKHNQYDDIETPAHRMLFDDKPIRKQS
jgi:cbb3-type cytochrome oxidase maturation protein